MSDTDTPLFSVPSPVETPAPSTSVPIIPPVPEFPTVTPEPATPEPSVPVKSKGGRPRKHASPAAKVAAHRKTKKEAAEEAEEEKKYQNPCEPTAEPPEHPVRGKTPLDDKIFEDAMIVYRRKLAAYQKLWTTWLDQYKDSNGKNVLHLERGNSMPGVASSKGKIITGELTMKQLDLIDAAHGRQDQGRHCSYCGREFVGYDSGRVQDFSSGRDFGYCDCPAGDDD